MENWQREHIRKNLGGLLKDTRCDSLFLAELTCFLSDSDEADLQAKLILNGEMAQSKLLYDIAKTRTGAYEKLTNALFETKQYGAFQVLLKGFMNHQVEDVFGKCKIDVQNERLYTALDGFGKHVLQCFVTFQGQEMTLEHILPGIEKKTFEQMVEKCFKEEILVQLINNNRPVLVNSSVPEHLNYYITRRLTSRYHLNPKLFDKRCNDMFVIKHIQLRELSALAKDEDMDISSNQLDEVTARFILLEYEQDFDKICEISQYPVHLINHNAGQFTWIKSHGEVASLQDYVHTEQDELNEEKFTQSILETTSPVCISDTPGMGKTVLVASIAHQIMKQYPTRLVRFIVLREFVPAAQQMQKLNEESLITLIAYQSSEYDAGREIVKHIMTKSENQVMELIFDGFDEVLSTQVETAKQILKILKKCKTLRLYVTTRPHMRDQLENTLEVLGYNILAFGEGEQVNFLTKYWAPKKAAENENLELFANHCLKTLKENMNDFERDIAGIPLQCRMIAEVYESEAIKYSKPETRIAEFNMGVVIQVTSFFEIYRKLMEMRFSKLKNDAENEDKVSFLSNAHMYTALQLLFPSYAPNFKHILLGDDEAEVRELCDLGILEKKGWNDETLRFVHRTFAEYFFGLFVARHLLTHSDLNQQSFSFLFCNVLNTTKSLELLLSTSKLGECEKLEKFSFEYPVISYFINAHLKCNPVRITRIFWNDEARQMYKVLASCIIYNHPTLYKTLFGESQTEESEAVKQLVAVNVDRLPYLLLFSAKHSSFQMFKMIYPRVTAWLQQKPAFVHSSSPEFMITPLHVAVERGDFFITDYLLKKDKNGLKELKYLVHCCVAGSIQDNDVTTLQKREIIGSLCSQNKEWVNELMPDGTPPLLQSSVHIKLLECLVKSRADVNAVCRDGSVFHKLCYNQISPENFHDLYLFFRMHKFDELDARDSLQRTFLHVAVETVEILPLTMYVIHCNGFNFEAIDEAGDTVLFSAVRAGRSVNLIRMITWVNVHLDHKNFNDENMLHICAKYGNHNALEFFLQWELSELIRIKFVAENKNFETPFFQALVCGRKPNIHIIKLLEKNGFKITTKVASYGLKGLLCNKNIMAWELDNDFVDVADYLMAKGGVLADIYRRSPWELQTTIKHREYVEVSTKCEVNLLMELENRGILIEQRENFFGQSNLLYDTLQSYFPNSFERMCTSLISCDQIKPFLLLKQCLQRAAHDSTFVFMQPPMGLVEFVHSKYDYLIVLRSYDTEMSIERIKDTIDSNVTIIQEDHSVKLGNLNFPSGLTVYQCNEATCNLVRQLGILECKIICLCTVISGELHESQICRTLAEETVWEDFSKDFQNFMQGRFKEPRNFSKRKDGSLLKSIRRSIPQLNNKLSKNSMTTNSLEAQECALFPLCSCGKHPIGSKNLIWNVFGSTETTNTHWIDLLDIISVLNLDSEGLIRIRDQLMTVGDDTTIKWWRHINSIPGVQLRMGDIPDIYHHILGSSQIIQVAVNTCFPHLKKSVEINEVKKFVVAGVIQPKGYSFVFSEGTLAWCIIADYLVNPAAVKSTPLNQDIISNVFNRHDCIIDYDASIFGNNSESISFPTHSFPKERKLFLKHLEFLVNTEETRNKLKEAFPVENKFGFNVLEWTHACVHANYINILTSLMSVAERERLLDFNVVYIAIKFADIKVIEFVLKEYAKSTDIALHLTNIWYNDSLNSIFDVAAIRGNFTVMQYLIELFGCSEPFTSESETMKLIQNTVKSSHYDPNQTEERKRIVDLLRQRYSSLTQKQLKMSNLSLLLTPDIHVDLIMYLIDLGANVFTTDKNSRNILHLCPKYMTPNEYDKLVMYLYNRSISKIFHSRDKAGCTPFHYAVENVELLESTLELLTFQLKVDLNVNDNSGRTPLFYATYNRFYDEHILKALVKVGCDITKRDKNNRTVLHEAARVGNYDAVKYFISQGCHVNSCDDHNNTPLHLVFESFNKSICTHQTIFEIVEHGADVNAINKDRETPLSLALKVGEERNYEDMTKIIDTLKKFGALE